LEVEFLFEFSFVPAVHELRSFNISIDRASRHSSENEGLNTLSAHDSSPVVSYTEIVSIWLLTPSRTAAVYPDCGARARAFPDRARVHANSIA
jgi:hypothetical protein